MEEILRLEHLEKTFGTHQVLRDISFSVNKGDVISIIGSSGSGKSTMLRCVNLLEEPTGGKIVFEGKDIAGKELNLSQYRARVGMVFQQFNLFNNMNALENCVCPQLTVLHRKREEAEKIARDYLERVGMSAYCNARPAQLSGGQKQRVSMVSGKDLDMVLPAGSGAQTSVVVFNVRDGKLSGRDTFNMNAVFATYAYELDDQNNVYVGTHTEWGKGRFGRFQGMSQNF